MKYKLNDGDRIQLSTGEKLRIVRECGQPLVAHDDVSSQLVFYRPVNNGSWIRIRIRIHPRNPRKPWEGEYQTREQEEVGHIVRHLGIQWEYQPSWFDGQRAIIHHPHRLLFGGRHIKVTSRTANDEVIEVLVENRVCSGWREANRVITEMLLP